DGDIGEHGSRVGTADRSRLLRNDPLPRAAAVPVGRAQARATHAGISGNGPRARCRVGVSPISLVKVLVKVPRLLYPTEPAISVTGSEVVRSRLAARSIRRR